MNGSSHIPVSRTAHLAIEALEQAGFEAWLVGGCVRDALLGRDVHDFDITTSALWTETERVLSQAGFTVHRTGTKHGTVTASRNGDVIEVTTFRSDGTYSDSRHPDAVTFVKSIEEDLARRDFTINALAYHPERGLLDCFDGIIDLRARTIRTVGEPRKRFGEDALRIVRGCRFTSQLGFEIEPTTFEAMVEHRCALHDIAIERIMHELDELLLGDHVHDALVKTIDVLAAIMPEAAAMKGFEQHTPYHIYDVLEHTAWVVQRSPKTRLGRWAALFHDIGKPGAFFMDGQRGHFYGHARLSAVIARSIMERFLFSPSFMKRTLTLVRMHDDTIAATPRSVKRTLARLDGDVELFRTLVGIKRADALAQSDLSQPRLEIAEQLDGVLDEVLAHDAAFSRAQLAINGSDLLALGVESGPAVGRVLDEALGAVIDERVNNDRQSLLAYAKELVGQ